MVMPLSIGATRLSMGHSACGYELYRPYRAAETIDYRTDVGESKTTNLRKEQTMKKLIATTIAVLIFSASTFATGGVWITISGNSGQTNTQATEFRYSQSPRDLAGGSSSMAAVNAGTNARGAGGGGRAAMRRANDP